MIPSGIEKGSGWKIPHGPATVNGTGFQCHSRIAGRRRLKSSRKSGDLPVFSRFRSDSWEIAGHTTTVSATPQLLMKAVDQSYSPP